MNATRLNGNTTPAWQETANETLEDVKERFQDVDVQVRKFVRERPLVAVGAAVAAGFLVGRLFK